MMEAWVNHLDNCEKCKWSLKSSRLAGMSIGAAYRGCCEIGKPLYRAWILEIEGRDLCMSNDKFAREDAK